MLAQLRDLQSRRDNERDPFAHQELSLLIYEVQSKIAIRNAAEVARRDAAELPVPGGRVPGGPLRYGTVREAQDEIDRLSRIVSATAAAFERLDETSERAADVHATQVRMRRLVQQDAYDQLAEQIRGKS